MFAAGGHVSEPGADGSEDKFLSKTWRREWDSNPLVSQKQRDSGRKSDVL